MIKYLKKFKLTAQYEEYINSDIAVLPNVSVTNDDNKVHYNPIPNYLRFAAEEDNSTIVLNAKTSPNIKYSLNGGAWTQWDYSAITLDMGDTVYMKGNNSGGFSTSSSNYNQFQMTGKISASGNIMSLLYDDNFERKLTIPCNYCFYNMFYGCASLTTAPELPATKLANYCYRSMFSGCTNLTTAPNLPATTLASYCYYSMFYGCLILSTAPELPATTLTSYCYYRMFQNCTHLTSSPDLPAITLANYCYSYMFNGCTRLNSITCLATNIRATNCTSSWVSGVASSGTFTGDEPMTNWTSGVNGIPIGWTVKNVHNYSKDYLTFVALQDGTFKFSRNAMQYSLDNGTTWTTLAANTSSPTVTTGNKIMWKQTGLTPNSSNGIGTFSATGNFNVQGNIMSLLYGDNFRNKTNLSGKDYVFRNLFNGNAKIVSAENLVLPATTLASYCYYSMFFGCTNMTTAPELPATTLANYCYAGMFINCTSMTTAPELLATTLANYCCYRMFQNCAKLTTSPELIATTLTDYCYTGMFVNCTSLNLITCLATDISANSCVVNWVSGVDSSGTFIKAESMTSWTNDVNGIPVGWTIEDKQ